MAVNESETNRYQTTPPGKEKHTSPIPGGRAEGVPDSAFNSRSLAKGTKVEYEHTPDKAKAKDIAKDHLTERGDYYEKLEKMEKSAGVRSWIKGKAYGVGRKIGGEVRRGIRDEISAAARANRGRLVGAAVGLPVAAAGASYLAARAGAKAGTRAHHRDQERKATKQIPTSKAKVKKAMAEAFFDELQKIAEAAPVEAAKREHSVQSEGQLLKTLKPGDIIFSAPHRKRSKGFMGKVFKPISRKIQGTDFGHTALYVGGGKIVDTRIERAAKTEPIHKLVSKNNVVVVRPKGVTASERKTAVEYAKEHVGTGYSKKALLRAATPFQGKFKGKGPEEAKGLMCSGLAANAYSKRKFAPVSRKYIRPSQILTSKQVTPVAYLETAAQPM